MIAGVVVCGNTGSAEAALGGSEGKAAALASTGVGITVETVWSGTGCSRLTDSTGSSVNAVTAGNAISTSCGLSAGSSSNDEVSFSPSNASLASCVGNVISSMLSGIAAAACGAIAAVTSVNSSIAKNPSISAVGVVSLCKLSPFSAACSRTAPTDGSASDSISDSSRSGSSI